jgi:CheY-like chemotaxis protein
LPALVASLPGTVPPDSAAKLNISPGMATERPWPGLRGLKVMVVEDEEDCRNLVAKLLGQQGCLVREAASAAAALEEFTSFVPDILISDIGMPDADGYSLIRTVRKKYSRVGSSLGAIALTAHARSEDREQALAAGFDLHLAKPLVPNLLFRAVSDLAGRRVQAPKSPV